MAKPRIIALYLPQYHPFPENDEWWGKGFTEWTNVARARALFRGHEQPHIPADLGFYDLRMPEIRKQQAELARQAGIEAFCYYDYYFGNGKRLMERPFDEVVASGEPNFPFCLCWANHSWYKKLWDPKNPGKDKLLIEQKYDGEKDYTLHFMTLLPAFKDKRYVRVNGKLFYAIYDPMHFADVECFIKTWRKLAAENGLDDFYFVAADYNSESQQELFRLGFDATHNLDQYNIYHLASNLKKAWHTLLGKYLKRPRIYDYEEATRYMLHPDCSKPNVIPVILPNWDHTPRSGARGVVMKNATPAAFKRFAKRAIECVKDKPEQEQIIILKSWNEWGEGNYMEPDLQYGHGYINALKEAIEESR